MLYENILIQSYLLSLMTLLMNEIEARSKLFRSVGREPHRHLQGCNGRALCSGHRQNDRPVDDQINYNLAIYYLTLGDPPNYYLDF